ncbi:MAG: HDOD domain-containing protein [Colwellia sp.]|nr:HDOD domain-containing protein [Colwellia sp.]
MSVDMIISISILLALTYFIWRLNSTKRVLKTKVSRSKNSQARKSASQTRQNFQTNILANVSEPPQVELELPADFLSFKLLISDKLNEKQQKIVIDISQSFRKPHPLLLPLTQGVFEPNELFDLIKTDAEMTAKILNAVNSSLFALRQPITNINHAIIFLGISQVKNIAMQFAVQNNMEFTDKTQNKAYKKLWTASYLASSFCLLFANEMNEENPAELSTHCLLSYLGDLAILSYKPSVAGFYLDDYTLFDRSKVFQNTLNTNAAVVGKHIVEQWQLPKSIETGIEHSISPLTNEANNQGLSSEQLRQGLICYLSCRLGDLIAFGDVRDITQVGKLSFDALGKVEFYYLQENIKNMGLDKINAVFAEARFKNKINKVIEQVLG